MLTSMLGPWRKLLGKKKSRSCRRLRPEGAHITRRPGLEILEDRLLPASMVFGGLEFMTSGTFTTDNNVVTSSDPVQVGVNPARGATFKSVLQLDKGVQFTTTDKTGTFTTNGTVSGISGTDTLQLLDDQMHTFTAPGLLSTSSYFTLNSKDVNQPHLTVGGGMLAVMALHLNAQELDLQGTLSVSGISALTITVGGQSHAVINSSGVSMAGPDPSVAGPDVFTQDGVMISVQNLDVHTDQADGEFDITGQASVTVGGNTLDLMLGNSTTPGLVIQNGQLESILATVTPPKGSSDTQFMFHGLSLTLNSATFSYDSASATFGIGADATLLLDGHSVQVTLGSAGMPGIVIQNGALYSLDGSVTSDIEIGGVTFKTDDLGIHYAPNDPTPNVQITGMASFEFDDQTISVALGSTDSTGTSYAGIAIDLDNGSLLSLAAAISTDITISDLTIKADALGIHYVPGGDFSISGSASFDLHNDNATPAEQTIALMFGGNGQPGIDIDSNGNLVSLNAAISTDLTLGGLEIKANSLGINYQPASGNFVISGGASFTLDGHTVSLNLGGSYSPGLVIGNGVLESFQASVSGEVDLLGLTITADNLSVAYVAAAQEFALFGGVSVSCSAFDFSTTLGNEQNPGLLIENGAVQKVNISVSGGFSLGGFDFTANGLTINYSAANNLLELSGGVTLDLTSEIQVSATLSQGGLVINTQTGALSIDSSQGLTIMGSATIGGFGIQNLDISFSNGPNGINFSASGSVMLPDNIGIDLTELKIVNGQLADIGVTVNAPIPIGDTGFFLDSLSGDLENLNDPANLQIMASVEVSFGDKISVPDIPGIFPGGSFALVDATGSITISASDFNLSGQVSLLGGLLGQGSASIDLNFATGVYTVSGNFSMFDGIVSFGGSLTITSQGDITLQAMASINVPPQIPFIGGDSLGNINFYLQYRPGEDWTQSYVAAWTNVNLFFVSFTIGFKVDFQGDFSLISGDQVAAFQAPPTPAQPLPMVNTYTEKVAVTDPNAVGDQVIVSSPAFYGGNYPSTSITNESDSSYNNSDSGGDFKTYYALSQQDAILETLSFDVYAYGVYDGQGTFTISSSHDPTPQFNFAPSGNLPYYPIGAEVSSGLGQGGAPAVITLDWGANGPTSSNIVASYRSADAYLSLLQNTQSRQNPSGGYVQVNTYSIDATTTSASMGAVTAGGGDALYTDQVAGQTYTPPLFGNQSNRTPPSETSYQLSHGPVKNFSFTLTAGQTLLGIGTIAANGVFTFAPNGTPAEVPTSAVVTGNDQLILTWPKAPGATSVTATYNSLADRVIDIDFNTDTVQGGDYGQYEVQLVTISTRPLDPAGYPTFAQSIQYKTPTVSFSGSPTLTANGALSGTLLASAYTPESQQAGDTSTTVSLYYHTTNSTADGTLIGTYDYRNFTNNGAGSPNSYSFSWPGFANLPAGKYYLYAVINDSQNPNQVSSPAGPFTETSPTPALSGPSFLALTPSATASEQGIFSTAADTALGVTTNFNEPVTIDVKVNGGGNIALAGGTPATEITENYASAALATSALNGLTFDADNTFVNNATLTITASTDINGTMYTGTETIPLLTPNTHLVVTQQTSGTVNALTLTDGGSGYEFAPTVVFTSTDGLGSGAAAIANLENGQVVSLTLTSPGIGYDAPPTVSLEFGNPTTQAQATDTIIAPPADPDSAFVTLTVTNPGGPDGQDGTNVQVKDSLPQGVTVIAATPSQGTFDPTTGIWTIGNLPMSGANTATLALTVKADATTDDKVLANTATASSTLYNYPASDAHSAGPIFPISHNIVLTPSTLPDLVTNFNYSLILTADRGDGGPYTYALAGGALPYGLNLSSNGVLSGLPLPNGTLTDPFSVTVTSAAGISATLPVQVNIPGGDGTESALWTTGTPVSLFLDNTAGASYSLAQGAYPPGTNLQISGNVATISGTPTTPGEYSFTVDEAANGATLYQSFPYTVLVESPVTLGPTTLPAADVGTYYSQQLTATGGSGFYTFSADLPDGLTLSPGGLVSGFISPQILTGVSVFTVTVADAYGIMDSVTYSFTINPALQLPAALPAATAGISYSEILIASGGTGTGYTYTLTSGSLPPGLTLSPDGTISGTIPPGTLDTDTPFFITVTDSGGASFTQTYTLAINPALAVSPTDLPGGAANTVYSAALTATGGSDSGYTFALTGGNLPPGLTLAANGTIGGTISATATGYYSFTVTVTDSANDTVSATCALFVDPVLTAGPGTLPGATVNTAYSQKLSATGGSGIYNFAVSTGSLPAGLTLSAAGLLSGTIPNSTRAGTYDFTVTVTDTAGMTFSTDYSFVVAPFSVTWTGVVSTVWNNPANWSSHAVPGPGDNVTIPIPPNGRCPVLNVAATVDNLAIQSRASLSLAGHALAVGGNFTNQGTLILQGNEATQLANGNDTKEGTWQYVGDGSGGTITVASFGATDYFNLTIADGHSHRDAFLTAGDLTIGNNLVISRGTLTPSGNLTTACVHISGGTLNAPAVLNDSGNWSVTGGAFNPGSGTVFFTAGSGTQQLQSGGKGFYNLTHSGAGTLTLSVNGLTVNEVLSNTAGTFQNNNLPVTVSGATTVSGGTIRSGTAAEHFRGGLTVNGGSFLGTTGALSAAGIFITAGTLTAPKATLTDTGDWNIAGGTFNANNGTVVLAGTNQQISGNTTFDNLTKLVSAADTLTFQAGSTQIVTGTLTLEGRAGKLLSLRSSVPQSPWSIDVHAKAVLAFLNVEDSDDTGPIVLKTTKSVNAGDNTRWLFA